MPGDAELLAKLGFDIANLAPETSQILCQLWRENVALREEIVALERRQQALVRLADQDSLVPIGNRRSFMRELERAIRGIERYGTPGAVLFFDLNDLKLINDNHGHAAGDAALRHVAELLRRNLRASDVLARLGGDEFAVLLMWAGLDTARRKAQDLIRIVASKPLAWASGEIDIALACGAYAFAPGETADGVLEAADREMYRCKELQKRQR